MKKLFNTKTILAAVTACLTILSTGCSINVDLTPEEQGQVSEIIGQIAETAKNSDVKVNVNNSGNTVTDSQNSSSTENSPVTEIAENNTDNEEAAEVKDETEAPAEEMESQLVEIQYDGTAVVLEDGIRYGRMTYDPKAKYGRFSAEEIEKINEDLRKIEHDAYEKYGNWLRSSTEEQQHDGVSFVKFNDIDDPSGYLKDIWVIDLGSPVGKLYYDMHTLEILTIEDLFGSDWLENNTVESADDTSGSQELQGKITYFYDTDTRKVHIIFENDYRGINIDIIRDNIVQDYVGVIDGSAK